MNLQKEAPALLEQRQGQKNFMFPECKGKDRQFQPNAKVFSDFSPETEKLMNLIQNKKEYLAKLTNDFARKKVQAEINFLEGEILPIVLNETTLLFSEITKYHTAKIHEAINYGANAMVVVIPLTDSPDDTIRIATINPHRDNPIEGVEIGIEAHGCLLEEIQL